MYCISCGEKKRCTTPKDRDGLGYYRVACSQACLAGAFLIYASCGEWSAAHCGDCGHPQDGCQCEDYQRDRGEYHG